MISEHLETHPRRFRIEKEAGEQFIGDDFRFVNSPPGTYRITRISITWGTEDKGWSLGIADLPPTAARPTVNHPVASGTTETSYMDVNAYDLEPTEWLNLTTLTATSAMTAEITAEIVSQNG